MTRAGRALDLVEEGVGELISRHRSDDTADLDQFKPYRDEPVGYAADVLDQELTPDQEDALELLASEDRVAWQAAQAVGKSRTIAVAALWWSYARQGQVLISAPTARTVQEVIMRKELARLWRPRPELAGDLYTNSLRIRGDEPAILAYTATSASGATGQHDPEGGVLAILDEAQGVPPEVWVAMDANTTGERDRQFVCGNPTDPTGDFFEVCREGSGWATVQSSALEHPNLDPDADQHIPGGPSDAWLERMRDRWGEESSQWTARVLGRFPQESEDALVSHSEVEASFCRHDSGWATRWEQGEPLVCGLDVARKGADRTVLCIRKGRRVQKFVSWGRKKTMQTVGRVIEELRQLDDLDVTLAVDVVAVGAGVADRLAELRREQPAVREIIGRLVEFDARKRARKSTRFVNRRSEAYWHLRERLEEGELAIPRNEELREELTSIRWTANSSGKVKLEPKDDLKARIGRSPDLADALAISLAPDARSSMKPDLIPM